MMVHLRSDFKWVFGPLDSTRACPTRNSTQRWENNHATRSTSHGVLPSFPNMTQSFDTATNKVSVLYQAYVDSLPDESTTPAAPGAISHGDLLERVRVALGFPPFGPIQLIDDRVVHRTSTQQEERTYGSYTRRWWTHVDRTLADDLEDFADELGVLADHERLADAPLCSRCRCLEVKIDSYGYYAKQCERCVAWSRATRADRGRCADCRRSFTAVGDGKGSRCGRCYIARRDRFGRETPDHREERLEKQRHYRFLTPPWERRPRDW